MRKYIYLWITSLLLVVACTDDDRVFSESSDARGQAYLANCNKTLKASPEGWKLVYYPKAGTYGGYTFLFSFKDEGRVDMLADIARRAGNYSYKLTMEESAILSFDSYSPLHILADPQYVSLSKGLEGDFEFVIRSVADDSIKLVGKKNRVEVALVRATAADWESVGNLPAVQDLFTTGAYELWQLYVNGEENDGSSMSLDSLSHVCSITYRSDGDLITVSVPYLLTDNGCQFSKRVEIEGVSFDALTLVEGTSGNNRAFESNDPEHAIRVGVVVDIPLNLTPEQIPTFEQDPGKRAVELFRSENKDSKGISWYKVVDMSDDLKALWDELIADRPNFREFMVILDYNDKNPGAFSFRCVEEGVDKYYRYGFDTFDMLDGSLDRVVFKNSSGSKATNSYNPSPWANRGDYTGHANVTSMRKNFFFSSSGFTVIRDYKDTYWFRSIKNPEQWWKLKVVN